MEIDSIIEDWCVVEPAFAVSANRHWESVLALGTGYITTRASLDEGLEDDDQGLEYNRIPGNVSLEVIPARKSRWGTYMPVVQARHPLWRVGLVNLPYYLGFVLRVDGEKLDLERSKVTGYRRWLNLKTATLFRSLSWETRSGKRIDLLFVRYMDPGQKFLCVQECRIKSVSGAADVVVESYVDNDIRTNGFQAFAAHTVHSCESGLIYSDVTTNLGTRVVTASRLAAGKVSDSRQNLTAHRVSQSSLVHVDKGATRWVRKFSASVADAYFDKARLVEEADALLLAAIQKGDMERYLEHVDQWARFWDVADIQIEAHDREGYNSQLAIRTAIYHLLRAKTTDESRGMICPKGTTSEVYMGSVFWDMEIFIEPFYIYAFPDMARCVHLFRHRNLPEARALTRAAGYRGVRYPWMSAADGSETCPMWEYADHQIHVTSDVVIGLWHYFLNSRDDGFLFDHGAEIILETARYWTQRAERIPGRQGYHLYGVMGPDEYKPLTNNNAYTNHCAKFNLMLAVKVAEMLKAKDPVRWEGLVSKLNFDASELRDFQAVAQGLSILKDGARNIIWQCEDFESGFAEPDIEALWEDRDQLFGTYCSQEKRYRSKTLKQADVVALLALFSEGFNEEEKAASFDYYWPYTIHDSSNSMCHHQVVLANLGRAQEAYEAWLKSIDIDFGDRFRAENGVHFANVGGMWQEMVFGFCGMVSALNADILTFHPCLPAEFQEVRCNINWKGAQIGITLTHTSLTLHNFSEVPVQFVVNNDMHLAEPSRSLEVSVESGEYA